MTSNEECRSGYALLFCWLHFFFRFSARLHCFLVYVSKIDRLNLANFESYGHFTGFFFWGSDLIEVEDWLLGSMNLACQLKGTFFFLFYLYSQQGDNWNLPSHYVNEITYNVCPPISLNSFCLLPSYPLLNIHTLHSFSSCGSLHMCTQ